MSSTQSARPPGGVPGIRPAAALVSVAVPCVITMLWFLPVSWLVGLPAGFLLYLLLNRERSD